MILRLTQFPIIKPLISAIDKDIKRFGFPKAMLNTASRLGTPPVIAGITPQISQILKKEAVVLVANHIHEVDIIALIAALPQRENISLIISSAFMNLVPNADKYLIPVYIDHHKDRNQIQLKEKLFKMFHPVPTFNPDDEHKKNILSVKNASGKLKKGGLVIIFPNPRKTSGNNWYSGIGHLLRGASGKTPVYFVKAYIEGTSNLDYIRLLPYGAKILTQIKVTFSEEKEISRILDNNAKTITQALENSYNKWVRNLQY